MSLATAESCLNTARMFLNDQNSQLWNDNILMPMLVQAHLELQAKLKARASPVMKAYFNTGVNANIATVQPPQDMLSPIQLWEAPLGAPPSAFQLMTETDILPIIGATPTLVYWTWIFNTITVVPALINSQVLIIYWRRIPFPVIPSDPIGIFDGEQYLGPRTAAIAMGSVGEENTNAVVNALAQQQLDTVIIANKGRGPILPGGAIKP